MVDHRTKKRIVAVVGVSQDPDKFGFKIFKDLLGAGVNAVGINPNASVILGRKIYRNLEDLLELPDLVVTVVPPPVTEKIVEECHRLGIKEIWMQPGSESEESIKKAKQYKINATHHACIMTQNGIW